MSINKCCENCIYKDESYVECDVCSNKNNFIPEEEVVRRDEREKMIEKIKKFYHSARNEKFSNSMNFLELLLYLDNEEKEN